MFSVDMYHRAGIVAARFWEGAMLGRQDMWEGWWQTLLELSEGLSPNFGCLNKGSEDFRPGCSMPWFLPETNSLCV